MSSRPRRRNCGGVAGRSDFRRPPPGSSGRAVRPRRSGFRAAELRRHPPVPVWCTPSLCSGHSARRACSSSGWPDAGDRRARPRTAAATFVALGGTSLTRTGDQMATHLAAGDVEAARRLLPSLCGRDPSVLDAAGLARAALESVAENTSDAQVAPAAVGRRRRGSRDPGVPRRQHSGRDDRSPLAAVRPIRLGCSSFR